MKGKPTIDLGLTAYDELFMTDQERAENRLPKIYDIPLDQIDDFPDHPFKVRNDDDMAQLIESVKARGIITPITLRPKEDGRYEIISGHRRRRACEMAGFQTIPAEIKEMSKDEAIILMVESNLQRSVILPSEKAFSYKMRYEALRRQAGFRSDLTGDPVGPRLKTSEMVAQATDESATQIKRYIRLTELIPDILQMVDDGRIALRPAVELSYLTKQEQANLYSVMELADATPSHAQAMKMRRFSSEGKLTMEVLESIISEEKPNQKEKITLIIETARKYIPASVPYEKTNDYILKALQFYARYQERQREASR